MHIVDVIESEDKQTCKFLFELSDGHRIESVLILSADRRTVCISTQVGCAGGCVFCASGKKGFIRNLTTEEIVEQVMQISYYLAKIEEKITHLVFMGMGEPLFNYENVAKSLQIFTDPKAFGMSQRRITLSTVGIVEGIDRLREDGWKINLAFSLHASSQKKRENLIRLAKVYPVEKVLSALKRYFDQTGRNITFEYILIENVNDSKQDAYALSSLICDISGSVNLIPYNPIEAYAAKRPSTKRIESFERALREKGIHYSRRYTKGKDIAASCGQLAMQNG